jgi:hypothetical protein
MLWKKIYVSFIPVNKTTNCLAVKMKNSLEYWFMGRWLGGDGG